MIAMKKLVIYRSVLGTTKHYAIWLGEALQADVIDFNHINTKTLNEYNMVIVMSGTYAGKMPLVRFLKDHWTVLQDKKVVVVAVGIAPVEEVASRESYKLIPVEIRSKVRYFKLPGSFLGLKPAGEPSKEKLEPVISYIHGLN